MKKLTMTLASALAALLMTSGAWAGESDLDYDHISRPADGYYVFWEEEELNAFLDELDEINASAEEGDWQEEGAEGRRCTALVPVVDYAWTMHDENEETEHWHVTTYITWSSFYKEYQAHKNSTGSHMWNDVDQIKVRWRDNDAGWYCDYCDEDNWGVYYTLNGTWWFEMQSSNCFHYWGAVYYYGSETDAYDDTDMSLGRYAVFSCSKYSIVSYLALAL